MLKHRINLCFILLVLHQGFDINSAQLRQLPVFIQKIPDSHCFIFCKGDRNNGITMQIFWEYAASNGIAVQPNHEIDDSGPITDFYTFVCNFVAEQFFCKVSRLIDPLHKTQPGIGPQVV